MKRKRLLLIVIVGVLVVLNILQITSNINNQKKIDELEKQISHDFFSSSRTTPLLINENLVNAYGDLILITIISEGCTDCMYRTIKYLNELDGRFENRVYVYYAGNNEEKLNKMGANFSVEKIDLEDVNYILNEDFTLDNPISFIIDSNMRVQSLHESDPLNPRKSKEFFNRVQSLFDSISSNRREK